jgi:hypothetical protein
MARLRAQRAELGDRITSLQASIFAGSERLDQFRVLMNWNQEELEQWSVTQQHKEDDNQALEEYRCARAGVVRRSFVGAGAVRRALRARCAGLGLEGPGPTPAAGRPQQAIFIRGANACMHARTCLQAPGRGQAAPAGHCARQADAAGGSAARGAGCGGHRHAGGCGWQCAAVVAVRAHTPGLAQPAAAPVCGRGVAAACARSTQLHLLRAA